MITNEAFHQSVVMSQLAQRLTDAKLLEVIDLCDEQVHASGAAESTKGFYADMRDILQKFYSDRRSDGGP